MSETRSYYAVIPAEVRYDKSLPANAKLLYGEITALCSEKGFCWASNAYFSELYGVSERSVREWIGRLKEAGYIEVNIRYKDDGKTIDSRCISLLTGVRKKSSGVWKKTSAPYGRNLPGGTEENFLENNTDIIIQENKKDSTLTCTIEKDESFSPRVTFKSIVDMYNRICVSLPKVNVISEAREKAIRARLKRYTPEQFEQMFILAQESAFLKGGNSKNWTATFDWLISDRNFARVLDGNYSDARSALPVNNSPEVLFE
ncbi:MAG: helix-turn-helix domain-containing protein [Clostridia bacterium]|nr:helix-turn-helix domain-containing protein [Clostridia bacterium]